MLLFVSKYDELPPSLTRRICNRFKRETPSTQEEKIMCVLRKRNKETNKGLNKGADERTEKMIYEKDEERNRKPTEKDRQAERDCKIRTKSERKK